ncbi:MAG: glycosyltransferase family 4 protein [Candidatus Dormibacteraceae bacterium]
MPIRVAVDARIIGRRGIGRYTQALLDGLALFPERVAAIPLCRSSVASGLPNAIALRSPGYVLQEQFEYALRLGEGQYDLVHLTANTAPFLRSRWPPTVVTVHDVMYLMTTEELPLSPSTRQRLGRLYRWLAFYSGTRRVDHLIADSAYTASELTKRVRRLPPITVVHPGVDERFFQDKPPELAKRLLARYGLDAGHYYLHPGAVDPRKNTPVVVAAFERYRGRGGRKQLVVVGLSKADRAVLHISQREGLHLLPFVTNEDLLMLLQLTHGLIYVPSEEGFGYPLVEAMAAGVPAIITAIDVLEEMSAGCAVTVGAADADGLAHALWEFEGQDSRAFELVARGKLRAQEFTTRRAAEKTLLVYEAVVEAYPKGA